MITENSGKRVLSAVFILILLLLFCKNITHFSKVFCETLKRAPGVPQKETIRNIDKQFENIFWQRTFFIDMHGAIQKLLGKNEVGNFDVIKDNNGFLHRAYNEIDEEMLAGYADNLSMLYQEAQEMNIPFLYVQAPSDVLEGITVLPLGVEDYSNRDIDKFLLMLEAEQIPYLDARHVVISTCPDSPFYRTDHHWSLKAGFSTFAAIISHLNDLYGFDLDPLKKYSDLNEYTVQEYPNSFLGSVGIRTGKYYAGKDDFVIYVPNFETSFIYRHYKGQTLTHAGEGEFLEVFIDQPLLEERDYNNKYNAFLFGGHVENIIQNNNADNNLKCLLVADSFGRSMTPFLSMCFAQTVYLDPQKGRYDKSYLDYLKTYNPDVMIVMFNGRSVYTHIVLE